MVIRGGANDAAGAAAANKAGDARSNPPKLPKLGAAAEVAPAAAEGAMGVAEDAAPGSVELEACMAQQQLCPT